jgi:hypothetical protein
METQGYTNPPRQKKLMIWPCYFCFLMFGIMSGLTKPQFSLLHFSLAVVLALLIGSGMIILLVTLLKAVNTGLAKSVGPAFARDASARGLVFMIPFTVLALLAFFVLGWQAIMPFAAAAITTSAASAGTELIKQGGHPLKNVIVPSLLGMVFSTGWMLILSLLP